MAGQSNILTATHPATAPPGRNSDAQGLPVAAAGVAYILNKAAETVIPVRVRINHAGTGQTYDGPIKAAWLYPSRLLLSDPARHLRLAVDLAGLRWRVHTTRAGETRLIGYGDHAERVCFAGLRRRCIAWRALMQWLLQEQSVRVPAARRPAGEHRGIAPALTP